MAYDEKIAERVRRIFATRGDAVEKNMMGGISFMVQGAMCCRVSSAGLLIRVSPANREKILALPHVQPTEFAGRRMSGFVRIDPEGYRTEKTLAQWIERGIGARTADVPVAAEKRKKGGLGGPRSK